MVDPFVESNSILRRKVIQVGGELEELKANFNVLLGAAKKVVKTPEKAAVIMREALEKIEKGGPQYDPVTTRRLEDGAKAMKLPLPLTKEEAGKFMHTVRNGIAALQSLDSLGSDEANWKAWADMCALQDRAKKVKKKFKL